jgi:rod shape-determining protein MreC
VRAFFFAVLALLLLCFNRQDPDLFHLKPYVASMLSPVQYVVNAPRQWIRGLHLALLEREHLVAEVKRLRHQQRVFQFHLQQLASLQQDNKHLRALLGVPVGEKNKVSVAQVMDVASNPAQRILVINQGSKAHLYRGQAVFDAQGVLGQLMMVNALSSRVLLINDLRSAIPVEDNATGLRAIAEGDGNKGTLHLANVSKTASIHLGDRIVSSNIAHVFPYGYAVGRVIKVEKSPAKKFMTVIVAPSAKLDRSRFVLLLWPQRSDREVRA